MTFYLHRSERAATLADQLAGLLLDGPEDPFDTELVVVSAIGTERWLSQRLSLKLGASSGASDGVTAGIRFARPTSIVAELLGQDSTDPWRPNALIWPILNLLSTSPDRFSVDLAPEQLVGVATKLANLLPGYARQRPAMTQAWAQNQDIGFGGQLLPDNLRWQAELWRALVQTIADPSPDKRIAQTVAALENQTAELTLPARVNLFGYSRIPRGELELLAALSKSRDVHLWLQHPSVAAWDKLTEFDQICGRAEATDAHAIASRLLISLGRDQRELQRSITAVVADLQSDVTAPAARPNTLLGRLQQSIISDEPAKPALLEPTDRSVQIHGCYGQSRQVEVLRDVIAGLLADDPTLEPRDILVMVPNVETFAPLFNSAFGNLQYGDRPKHPAHEFRLQVADRSAFSTNPLLAWLLELLEVCRRGRLSRSEVLALANAATVRTKFGFDDDQIDRITSWVDATGVRWSIDADSRARFGVPLAQNSWRTGLDRLIAGVASSENPARVVGEVLPLDDVPSGDVDLVGRFVSFFDALTKAAERFGQVTTIANWAQAISQTAAELTGFAGEDKWQKHQLDTFLMELTDDTSELNLAEVISILRQRWSPTSSSASLRTGALTVCGMVPMRSVPHRVICLVGLDDGAFPRSTVSDGDDVLAATALTGERDARSEDRQLLLDAIMSAEQTLVITYSAADELQGRRSPGAVPLGEVLDELQKFAPGADLVTHHPLQPYDRRNVEPGALLRDGQSFSFDPAAVAGAAASRTRAVVPAPLLAAPLQPVRHTDLTLDELESFCQNPILGFWKQRLAVQLPQERSAQSEQIPITLDPLEQWHIGQRLLDYAIAGVSPQDAWDAIYRADLLPPGELGIQARSAIADRVGALVAGTTELRATEAETIDLDLQLPDGRRLTGTIGEIYRDNAVTVTYSTVRPKQRMRDWIRLLALTAHDPTRTWRVLTAGKVGRGTAQLITGPLTEAVDALPLLTALVELRDRGLTEPLPVPIELSAFFSNRLRRQDRLRVRDQTEREWQRTNRWGIPTERDSVEVVRSWGAELPYTQLAAAGFEEFAIRLWEHAHDHQQEAAL